MSKLVQYNELYEMSELEERSAKILSESTIQFIKNQLYVTRKLKENLKLDPNEVFKYAQDEAHIKGIISAYQFLLDSHEEAINSSNPINS